MINILNMIKQYAYIGAVIVLLVAAGLVYNKYSTMAENLKTVESQKQQAVIDRDRVIAINAENERLLKILKADKEAIEQAFNDYKSLEKETDEKVKERVVYIDRIVQLDPKTNNRELSPVLKGTIELMQKEWADKK